MDSVYPATNRHFRNATRKQEDENIASLGCARSVLMRCGGKKMLDISTIRTRKEELEKTLHCIEYAPKSVGERAFLDLEAYKELLELRKKVTT